MNLRRGFAARAAGRGRCVVERLGAGRTAASTQSTRSSPPLSPLSPSLPSPPPPTPPPPLPPVPDAPPPPAPDAPPPPAPKYYRRHVRPAGFASRGRMDSRPLMHDGDVASLGRTDGLAVVSAYWEVHDERWRSKRARSRRSITAAGCTISLARGSLGEERGVHRHGSNDCEGLEATYRVQTSGHGGSSGGKRTASEVHLREASATKASLRRLAPRGSLSGAEHAVRRNARHETHLAQQDQPRGICGAHADPQGRARATLMEWVDADQLSG